MKQSSVSFTTRLSLVLAVLLLAYGAFVALIGRQFAHEQAQESLQRLSHGLARHIVAQWPEITAADPAGADGAARQALLQMLMTVNPAVQVYLLDADGRVQHYIGEPGMVRQHQVDLAAVRAFLAGADLPLRGTDPMGSAVPRIFSAAMFPPRAGDTRPPGYLYVVLDGTAREQVAAQLGAERLWQGVAWASLVGLLLTLALGVFTFRRLSLPVRRLAAEMDAYQRREAGSPGPAAAAGGPPAGDEVQTLARAFGELRTRVETQAEREHRQTADHREMMASVAHDLRTPLTALHGHLEALAQGSLQTEAPAARATVLQAALAQSRKVGRLSQQLFELAALQSGDPVLQRERFALDEVVSDAVQKFEVGHTEPPVTLQGLPPGRLELNGDLQLIERALTNLIDNAVRHAPTQQPVRVSLRREGTQAEILIEDSGPGLPTELQQRLAQGLSLREPPIKRRSGGIGGLGLAIAQRVAVLHGGSLRPLPSPGGGTRLCLLLPLAAP
ncbi:histidine kinase [beta proteobacterium AAP121]|nr:histidine kinase [beta proteobacterium AAP65]KPF94092.1 histidine kinase [beta proteobacterium AAP121]